MHLKRKKVFSIKNWHLDPSNYYFPYTLTGQNKAITPQNISRLSTSVFYQQRYLVLTPIYFGVFYLRDIFMLFKLVQFGDIHDEHYNSMCIGSYLIWRFLGQINQLKLLPNISHFTVLHTSFMHLWN